MIRRWSLARLRGGADEQHGGGVRQRVPLDFVQTHMWYNLAAANGEKTGAVFRDRLARKMTPAQIAEA